MVKKDNNIITGNSSILRGINRTTILNIIREKEPISRIQIARLTGLNKSTVSSIIAELLTEDLIFEEATVDQNIGRNPINLRLKLDKNFVGAINIDSLVTRVAIADVNGMFKNMSSIKTEPQNPELFIKKCIDELQKLRKKEKIGALVGLGISTIGIVDSKNSIITFSPNLGWENFEIGKLIKSYAPEIKNVSVGNDARSAALAELWFGNHQSNSSNFVFLSVGAGLGTGIVIDNKILTGEYQASGEFGHMVIFEEGELCTCGNSGCWEAYSSDRAIVKQYLAKTGEKFTGDVDLTVQKIIDLAKNGDKTACEIIKKVGYYLGIGISTIIKALDPHTIVLGGRITQTWSIIYPEIENIVNQRAYFGRQKKLGIVPSNFTQSPFLLGAATLAIEELFDGFKITE